MPPPPPIPVVVDVVVTRGHVLGPAGYSRVVTTDSNVFDLHRSKDDTSTDISDDAAFLWCQRGAPGPQAITGLARGVVEDALVLDLGNGEQLSFLRSGGDAVTKLTGELTCKDVGVERIVLKSGAGIRLTRLSEEEAARTVEDEVTAKDALGVEQAVVAQLTASEPSSETWWREHESQLKCLVHAAASDPGSPLAARTIRVARRTLELVAKSLAGPGVVPDACPRCLDIAALGGGGLVAATAVDDAPEEASLLESLDQQKKKGFFGRIRNPSRSLLQAAQATNDGCEPLEPTFELSITRDPPSDDDEEPPDALQGLNVAGLRFAAFARRHPLQATFSRGRGTKRTTSEFLNATDTIVKESGAGCGQLLDHFLSCGGLDALLARIAPSAGLECCAQKLGEVLTAFEVACDRAAPTTCPTFALSYARHLQRAAHARLRRLAAKAKNTTKQYIDGRWDADEKIRQTCNRLARCLAQLAPDAFGEQHHQRAQKSWTQHVTSYWAPGLTLSPHAKALRLSSERFVWTHALIAFEDKERTPESRLRGLHTLSSVIRGCCAAEPAEVPPWASRPQRWETGEEVVAAKISRSGAVARIAVLAADDRRVLTAGLPVLIIAAQRDAISGTVVDDLTSLAVADASGEDAPLQDEQPGSWQTCWALAKHLDPRFVERQRDVLEKAFASRTATPKVVHLVARFASYAAERLEQRDDTLDGGLELLWRWASSHQADDCRATSSLRHLLRGAPDLDRAATVIAEKCVDVLGGEDSPGAVRAAELLASLVVAAGDDGNYRQHSPVDSRRRRRLKLERGLKTSLLDVAIAGAARHKNAPTSYEASLRLSIALAADALLAVPGMDGDPLPFLRPRDVRAAFSRGDDTSARWLAACAERLALDPAAADAALVELAQDPAPSQYAADAAAALFVVAEQPVAQKLRPPAYGTDSLPPPPVEEPRDKRHARVDALIAVCLSTNAVSKRRDALLARLATSDLRGRIITRGVDTLRTTKDEDLADRAADVVRRALKGRSADDAPPGLDGERARWILLEGDDASLLSPRLRVAQACALTHTVWFSRNGGAARAAARVTALCRSDDAKALRAALRLVASAAQSVLPERPPTPPTPTTTFRPLAPPKPPDDDALDAQALGGELRPLVEALGGYAARGSDGVARALAGDLLLGLARVDDGALAKVVAVAGALVDVVITPPATASRAALRLDAIALAGDTLRCGAALRRAALQAVATKPSASAAAFAAAVLDAARACPVDAGDAAMLSKAVASLVTDEAVEEEEPAADDEEPVADVATARLKLLASLLRTGAKAPADAAAVARSLLAQGGLDGAANPQALHALAALCDVDGAAARETCAALAALHGPPPVSEDLKDETSVAARLEAADVVRAAPSASQRFSAERLRIHGPPPLDDRRRERYPQNAVSVPAARRTDTPGLDNLGCTCYLNSTLQVLFASPLFRETVFALDASHAPLARELQLLVARMRARDAASVSPLDFIAQTTTSSGEAIDVRQQQDADEFLAKLLQDVEGMRSGTATSAAKLLQRGFGGVYLQEVKSVDGKHSNPKEDPFKVVSLELGKDRGDVEDCLRHYVAPEEVELRFVEGEAMLPSIKTTRIKMAPFNLMLHLKRFEFDYNTLSTRKTNQRLEFPHTLDLRPFMSDAGPPILYDLKGVVVHSGTAQSGHYYSFVKEQQQWTEFNDSHVAPFAIEELSTECFGGLEDGTTDTYGRRNPQRERTRNAFLLSYERRYDCAAASWARPAPPADVQDRVARENISLRRARAAFDERHCAAAASVAKAAFSSSSLDTRQAAALLSGALVARTLARARGDDAAARLAATASLLSRIADTRVGAEAIRGLGLNDADATRALCRRAAQHPDDAAREALCDACASALRAAPSDAALAHLLGVAAECPPPVPGRRAQDYERDASRAACDVLARVGARRGCREVLEGCVKASGGAVSEDALSQTTLRALLEASLFLGGAFAPRAEAASALLKADAACLDTLSHASVGALALACCGCLDRGTYSRAGTDEQRRRGAAARAVLKALVVDSTARSQVVVSALRGCVERCGTARPDESSASEEEESDEEGDGWHRPPRRRLDRGRPYGSSRQLRRACRALAVVVAVEDDHKQGRVSLVVRESLQTAETAFRRDARDAKVKAQVDAILNLCKREPMARTAVLDSGATRWLKSFAEGNGFDNGGLLTPQGEVPPLSSLHRGAQNDEDEDDVNPPPLPPRRTPRRKLYAWILMLSQQTTSTASYDSDDDPNELVGKRLDVRWSGGQIYAGSVTKHDDLGHHIRYDDGDIRVYADILGKTWRFSSSGR